MTTPRVSVIIPTYKRADLVFETLDSVFAQTFTDHEVIVVNDGSPDATAARLRPLAEARRIRYFEQPNAGQAAARNCGLAVARGEFVAFLDDDDLWPPDKLAWQVRWLEEHRVDVVAGSVAYLGGSGCAPTLADEGAVLDFASFFRTNPIISPGQVLIRRETLRRAGGWDEQFRGTEDLDLWFRLAKMTPFWAVNRPALRYRLHLNTTSSQTTHMASSVWAVLTRHFERLPPAECASHRREAVRFLQNYLGRRLVVTLRSALWHRQLHTAGRALWAMRPILGSLGRDPQVFQRFLTDCQPGIGIGRTLARWRLFQRP